MARCFLLLLIFFFFGLLCFASSVSHVCITLNKQRQHQTDHQQPQPIDKGKPKRPSKKCLLLHRSRRRGPTSCVVSFYDFDAKMCTFGILCLCTLLVRRCCSNNNATMFFLKRKLATIFRAFFCVHSRLKHFFSSSSSYSYSSSIFVCFV